MPARGVLLIIYAPTSLAESIDRMRLIHTTVTPDKKTQYQSLTSMTVLFLMHYGCCRPYQDIHCFLALCDECTTRHSAFMTRHSSLCLNHSPPSTSSGTLRTADPESDKHRAHLRLCGSANTVLPMKSEMLSCLSSRRLHHNPNEPATKLHWPGGSCQSDPGMLNVVHEISQHKPQGDGHVQEMIWLHQVEETCTAKLRRRLEMDDSVGCKRILNIHVSWKFQPVTKLSGKEFKRVWWMMIIYHRILWITGVRQYDVNPSNLMVYRTQSGLVMGAINDCDLSSPENGSGGHERIGMIPFMAMDLLTKKTIEDKAEPLYPHIAESFIWVLILVCLQYEDGKLLNKDRPLDCRLIGDALGCLKIKRDCLKLAMETRVETPPPHHFSSELNLFLLTLIASFYVEGRDLVLEGECMFRTWFDAQLPSSVRYIIHSPRSSK
ncbi:hypothetical protein EV424DRAFT_1412042 [Suillus variegatus]|nr:hypothetical protein EV424DRAFT_1412042 [Suillus variegatus]